PTQPMRSTYTTHFRSGLEDTANRPDLDLLPHVDGNGYQESTVGMRSTLEPAIDKPGSVVRQWHAMATQFLRQGLQQQLRFFLEHAWHQPFATQRIDLIQGKQGNRQRYTIAYGPPPEMKTKRHRDALPLHRLGEDVGGNAGRIMAHEGIARQQQRLCLLFAQAFMPFLQACRLADVRRKVLIVKSVNQGIVDQNVRPAGLMFQLFYGNDKLPVMLQERQGRIDFAGDQCLSNQQFPRLSQVNLAKMHPPAGVN